ncbi:MAG: 2,3-bisphosphoglycerate-independent phosphoglycerate mutase [Rhodospirillaceae bacterium]|nr:2,3-bisphosphoglycerate-independent phosphoglycerate mutase [Rhodospirillaceae bacterium]
MKPLVLCIMDGWGISNETDNNAIEMANTPIFDELMETYPNGVMHASGEFVGLPNGQMGNSEVGHMNLGAGRVVLQDLPRINTAIEKGLLAKNQPLKQLIKTSQSVNGKCHIIGLLSDGGVHSHQKHLEALANFLVAAGTEVYVHAISDGRDTSPKTAKTCINNFIKNTNGRAPIVSLIGRFYAMDRDNRWDRVQKAFNAIVNAEGKYSDNLIEEIDNQYKRGITDEFLEPVINNEYQGISDGDTLLFGNFRADRAREILSAIVDPNFNSFNRLRIPNLAFKAGLVAYSELLNQHLKVLFPTVNLDETIGEIVAEQGLKQLRIAETEKYPHVTFFLNGGREEKFSGEERILIPSPKVATYDLEPEMSARILTKKLVHAIRENKFDFIVVNYANPDMVGHTGDLRAAIKAVETVDECIGYLVQELKKIDGLMFLTSDHGNCEMMYDTNTQTTHTSHTTNLVPTVLVNASSEVFELKNGKLADVAPTLLELLGLPIPQSMNGQSMLVTSRN